MYSSRQLNNFKLACIQGFHRIYVIKLFHHDYLHFGYLSHSERVLLLQLLTTTTAAAAAAVRICWFFRLSVCHLAMLVRFNLRSRFYLNLHLCNDATIETSTTKNEGKNDSLRLYPYKHINTWAQQPIYTMNASKRQFLRQLTRIQCEMHFRCECFYFVHLVCGCDIVSLSTTTSRFGSFDIGIHFNLSNCRTKSNQQRRIKYASKTPISEGYLQNYFRLCMGTANIVVVACSMFHVCVFVCVCACVSTQLEQKILGRNQ